MTKSRLGPCVVPDRLDPLALRSAFSAFPSGVAILAAELESGPAGLTASSFTSVSLEPPLVLVCIGTSSRTWPGLRHADRIGVSVLSEHHAEVSTQLSATNGDRFSGLHWRHSDEGAMFLDGAAAWLDCSIEREIDAGDHNIAILRVHDLHAEPDIAPLVFHASQYRRLAP
jgi:flavin reductase (DIM6/NTAB) family NADH-FMN oxidoreductase RutF